MDELPEIQGEHERAPCGPDRYINQIGAAFFFFFFTVQYIISPNMKSSMVFIGLK